MRRITLKELKDSLGTYIKAAQDGEEILVSDDHAPIVRLGPAEQPKPLTIRPPISDLSELPEFEPVLLAREVDVVAVIRGDRDSRD